MSDRSRKLEATAAISVLGALAVAAGLGTLLGSPLWARALRATLIDSALTLAVAATVGMLVGFLAGSGMRLAENALGRLIELSSALPAVLLAAACLGMSGTFYALALGLGLLRGIEVAATLAGEVRLARERLELDAQSEVRLPLAVYYRRAMGRAVGPALGVLSLTPAWLSALDATGVFIRIEPLESRLSLGTLAARGTAWPLACVALMSCALYAVGRWLDGRFRPDEESENEAIALPLRRRTSEPPAA